MSWAGKVTFGAALLLLSACGSDAGVGGVTAREADVLNAAATRLDERLNATKATNVTLNPAAVSVRDKSRNQDANMPPPAR